MCHYPPGSRDCPAVRSGRVWLFPVPPTAADPGPACRVAGAHPGDGTRRGSRPVTGAFRRPGCAWPACRSCAGRAPFEWFRRVRGGALWICSSPAAGSTAPALRATRQGAASRSCRANGKTSAAYLVCQHQAGSRRAALSGAVRLPPRAPLAARARGAVAQRSAYHLAAALRAPAPCRAAPLVDDPAGPVPLRPPRRARPAPASTCTGAKAGGSCRAATAGLSSVPAAGCRIRASWC